MTEKKDGTSNVLEVLDLNWIKEIEAKNNQAKFDRSKVLNLIPQFHGLIGKVIL
jgi:hypothetical protein